MGTLFMDFCREKGIYTETGGCPQFSKSSWLSPKHPPFLVYRVLTTSADRSNIHYSNIQRANQFASDNQQPIVGIQMFYYGVGQIAVRMEDLNGDVITSNGQCGEITISPTKSPIVAIDFGQKDSNYRLLGMTCIENGVIVGVKMCLVVNS